MKSDFETIETTQLTNVSGGVVIGPALATEQAMSGTTDWNKVGERTKTGATWGSRLGGMFGAPGRAAGAGIGAFLGGGNELLRQRDERIGPQPRAPWYAGGVS